ncbi:MAG TPA: RNA polymerase sigma factor [Verrucomicrobiae bacterium]|nr:RNA polymerase sigma factor [Verrucomicrobiae bacterium]
MSVALDRLTAREESLEAFSMDEEAFRGFYARTSRPLHGYLAHIAGSVTLADDLLQESYYRFLRARRPTMTDDQMKSYLFKIGSNLVRDHLRGAKHRELPAAEGLVENTPGAGDEGEAAGRRADVARVLAEMTPRYRQLLWMAYVEGASHVEIAQVVGLKSQSVRPLLFRAREKMLALLKKHGLAPAGEGDR